MLPLRSRLHIDVLGPLVATVDGEPLTLGGRRQQAVLAVLLLARGRLVTADALVDALWGELQSNRRTNRQPVNAPAALQAYVSHLRRALEPGRAARDRGSVIVSRGTAYALALADDCVDAWRFEAMMRGCDDLSDPAERAAILHDALGLWRGPALLDHADESWAKADIERWTELHSVAREKLLQARLDCGESATLLSDAEALVREEPLHEERWRLLVLALYRASRQADALAALRRARSTLAEELGVDPGPKLRALEAEVLAQSESLAAPVRVVAGSGGAPRSDALPSAGAEPSPGAVSALVPQQHLPAPDPAADFVDRDREITALRRSLRDALGGRAGVAVIEGPAGIGKTRLLTELKREAVEAGATVLTGRGSPLEREYGLGVVRQLFDPLLGDTTRRDRLLAGSASSADAIFDSTSSAPSEHRSDGLFGVLHSLYWLTVNLASEGAVVIAVDDLQWCDSGSLRYLGYLTRRLESLPVLIVTTLRTGESHEDPDLIAEVTDDPHAVAVRPEPLTRAGITDLVKDRLGPSADDVFIGSCHHTTSGNPLLLRQLLRALEADRIRPHASHADTVRAIGSRAVSSMVLRRFGRMPDANRAVARAVAVLGDGASLPAVAALAGLTDTAAASAIASLARAEVLRDEYPLGFVHPLVEDAVYGDLPPGERELQHERAAEVLSSAAATPERIAAHLLLVPSRGDPAVVDTLREAASRDAARGASQSATAYLRRAIAEPPGHEVAPELLLELGEITARINGPAAVQPLRNAYRTLAEPHRKADAAVLLARTLVFVGERGVATRVAQDAMAELPDALTDQRQHLLALVRIAGYMHALDPSAYNADTTPTISGDGPGARALAASLSWELLIEGHDRAQAISLAEFALEGGTLQRVDAGLLWVVAANSLQLSGVDTMPFWERSLTLAYERGTLFAALATHLWRGYAQWMSGDLPEAQQSMLNCTDQNVLYGAPRVGQPYTDAFLIQILLDRGDHTAARELLDAVKDRERIGEGVRLYGEAEARVLQAEGRHHEALMQLEAVQDEMGLVDNPAWRPWRSLRAQVLRQLGRREEALDLLHEELALARRWGAPAVVGRLLRLVGETTRGPSGLADICTAVDLLRGTTARLERARALVALGGLLAESSPRGKRDPEALAALTEAFDLAEVCGARGLRRELADMLARGGVVVPDEPEAARQLTTTERRITAMTLDGALDREIAQALFMTPGAVQQTVASVCSRLGASTVADLEAALQAAAT